MSNTVTAEDLEYGLGVLARIIDTQGDAVWPLFERLERELEVVKGRRQRVKKIFMNYLNLLPDRLYFVAAKSRGL